MHSHGSPRVGVSALINEFARLSKVQPVLVLAQLYAQGSDRSLKLCPGVAFT